MPKKNKNRGKKRAKPVPSVAGVASANEKGVKAGSIKTCAKKLVKPSEAPSESGILTQQKRAMLSALRRREKKKRLVFRKSFKNQLPSRS